MGLYPARLLLVEGRPEDCLDGPEVLEGEVVVAILSPPVWLGIVGKIKVSQQEMNMAVQNEKAPFPCPWLRQSITRFNFYIIFLIASRYSRHPSHQDSDACGSCKIDSATGTKRSGRRL